MAKELFVLSNDSKVEPLEKHQYEWEQELQSLIAKNPQLISRNRQDENPTLYLVDREVGVYEKSNDQSTSYSLDHLYVSADCVPVLVEVKRSQNTQARREVVAQMIDYASRAAFWDKNVLRELALKNNKSEVAMSVLDSDDFWDTVETNLKAEKLRMVFVADEIPSSLIPLIEFLDNHLNGIDVYGVSLTRYQSNGATMYAKDIIERPEIEKSETPPQKVWNYDSFLAQAVPIGGQALHDVVKKIMDWAIATFPHCGYGKGKYIGFFMAYIDKSSSRSIFMIEPWGTYMRIRIYPKAMAPYMGISAEDIAKCVESFTDIDSYVRQFDNMSFAIDCMAFADDSAFERLKEYATDAYSRHNHIILAK